MRNIHGMSIRDWKILEKMMENHDVPHTETLAEHIEANRLRTEERTSKRGIQLVKVYFENGIVREYEKAHLGTTTFFGK